jgi:hypothetical protein
MGQEKWFETSYRRNLIDMHIEGWDERFLSKLDPVKYVENLKKAHIQTAMVYANSHVGYCYWPTSYAAIHPGLKGTDFLGQVIRLLHKEKMSVVVYYSLLFDNWAYEHHPSWRMLNPYGCGSRESSPDQVITGGRFGVCCPNNPSYREHTALQIRELCGRYEFEGMFFDMTFWLTICHCPFCIDRYSKETSEVIPDIVDWYDPKWILFQQKREEWITEYTRWATSVVKDENPSLTVEYNFATASSHWIFGVTEGIAQSGDYTGGDLFGGISQQSFICKLYGNMTASPPFEYMTSRCDPNLAFHTTTKSESSLEQHVFTALAHHGAFLIIDAIDPDGTIQEELYRRMDRIFLNSMKYEPFLGGSLVADVGIYFSLRSKMDFAANGKPIRGDAGNPFGRFGQPHLEASLGAHETLKRAHVPVSVISKGNLGNLADFKVLVLPDIYFLDDEEITAIREYVIRGGNLYISGHTCRVLPCDLTGISTCASETHENYTYMKLTDLGQERLDELRSQGDLTVNGKQFLFVLNPADKAEEVLATVVLPFTNPEDKTRFASIHSNPPGVETAYPAISQRKVGKGNVIRLAAPIEKADPDISRTAYRSLIRMLIGSDVKVKTNAPSAVEVVVFRHKDENRYIISFVNEQEILPPVPVYDLEFSIRMDGDIPLYARLLPEEKNLPLRIVNGYASVKVRKLELFQMVVLCYEPL